MRYLVLFILLVSFQSFGQLIEKQDRIILNKFFDYAQKEKLHDVPLNDRIVIIGKYFLNTPYKAGTLENNKEEKLVVNLHEFDCVTFVDNVLALALWNDYSGRDYEDFFNNLLKLRYRNGSIEDYTSRLHYSSDWLYEMNKDTIVRDVTNVVEAQPFINEVNFISNNYTKYPALKDRKDLADKMANIEKNINDRTYYFIPKNDVKPNDRRIQNGDIILFTTDKSGLDTSHVGIAVKVGDNIHLLHASISAKKVVITEVPLSEYLKNIKSHTGIMLGRV